jgi:cytochrome c-type biogenesis protein CcmH
VTSNWTFWAIAAAFVVVALALVLTPLWRRKAAAVKVGRRNINIAVYRDQLKEMEADRGNGLISDEQFGAAKLELEARLAQDAVEVEDVQSVRKGGRLLGAGLAVLIPVAAIGLYSLLGNPAAFQPGGAPAAGQQATSRDIQAMMQAAEDKVKANPDDVQTWGMLARAYGVLDKWPDAVRAYENLMRLKPNDADTLSHYGEAIALMNGRNLEGKPMELVRKALEIDGKNLKGLELAGIYAFQNKQYKDAVKNWQQLVDLSPPGDQYTQDIQSALNQARQLAGEGAKPALDNLSGVQDQPAASGGKTLTGTLSLSAKLKDKVSPGDVVFLFARDAKSGGAPLAAIKLDAASLPAPFQLDDSQAMMAGNALSTHDSVSLTARISKSGTAEPKPGDLEGSLQTVKVGSSGIRLVIDRVR